MTGMSDCWRTRRNSSMPSMRGILMSKMPRSAGSSLKRLEGGGAVIVGAHLVAFRLERHAQRGEDVALVVDERDRALFFHHVPTLRQQITLPRFMAPRCINCGEANFVISI